jgi:predicted nucleic acid-binding protein
MKAVADSSVLISLSAIGQHSLLLRRFPSGILIPKAVWQEIVESGQGRSGAGEIAR